jgi:hypothetical protein
MQKPKKKTQLANVITENKHCARDVRATSEREAQSAHLAKAKN